MIAAGLGYRAPAVVGAVLAVAGLVVLCASVVVERQATVPAAREPDLTDRSRASQAV